MSTLVHSFAEINIGFNVGSPHEDVFEWATHDLPVRSCFSDVVQVDVGKGVGIDILSKTGVPADESTTCWRVVDQVLRKRR